MDIITRIRKANFLGRGGANFSTAKKWEMFKNEKMDKKYIICNASEGEPDVFKDEYLIANFPEEIINGIKIALDFFSNSQAYIYLRKDLYLKFGLKLKKIIKKEKIKLFKETGGYLCGEETTLISSMEHQRREPKIKPPYPLQKGLKGKPTLINNVETFYYISKIAKQEYKKTRFYCISKDAKKQGVFELPIDWSVKKILQKTKNYPEYDFFVQVGGGACGKIVFGKELNKSVCGTGAIIVYNVKQDLIKLMQKWVNFYINENCGKCVPCREGFYRIREILNSKKIDWKLLKDILEVMKETSLCGLGTSAPTAFLSLMEMMKYR
ncbi:MAG: NADH-ubiquinone oxidoreductase-F iron-sulfur binding region domain-containing protein [Patescibacteria group bacterium]|nr:NADH-ubiquinone oxidoreductase-F iron-sulfur binding region domain-containing protein [Patescibacteria group bacterium]